MITIAFKTTEEQEEFIRQQAEARKTSVSEVIRSAIAAMRKKRRCRIVLRPGNVVIYPPPDSRTITDEDLKAAEEEYYQGR